MRNLSIGVHHPSVSIPFNLLNINDLGFITVAPPITPRQIIDYYPGISIPIRTPILRGSLRDKREKFLDILSNPSFAPTIREYSRRQKVQIIINDLFNPDYTLISPLTETTIFTLLDRIQRHFNNPQIIIDEVKTSYILEPPLNFNNNPLFRLFDAIKQRYPGIDISLGIQTIGDYINKDDLLTALPLFLNKIKSLSWFTYPLHFTNVAYFYQPFSQYQQSQFLDTIRSIAIFHGIDSLCYFLPWDKDNSLFLSRRKDTICGLWDEEWNVKYNIFA